MKIIAICNQKGGVGKTTSSVNIAAFLGRMGHRTLLIDMDPQGNASSGVDVQKNHVSKSIYHALIGESLLSEVIRKTNFDNLSLAPSNRDLVGAEIELMQAFARESKLKNALNSVRDSYDYCIIDCPPSLNLLTVNALTAAEEVLIPVQTEYYALEGLAELVFTIESVRQSLNSELRIGGMFFTMYDPRVNLGKDVIGEVQNHIQFKDKVFRTVIPRNVTLSESSSYGVPVFVYDAKSRGSMAYQELAEEMHARMSGIAKGNLRLLQ